MCGLPPNIVERVPDHYQKRQGWRNQMKYTELLHVCACVWVCVCVSCICFVNNHSQMKPLLTDFFGHREVSGVSLAFALALHPHSRMLLRHFGVLGPQEHLLQLHK